MENKNKYCHICKKETDHSEQGCLVCESANVTVGQICDKMNVCRQAVYTKAERKGLPKRYFKPPKGKKYLLFTEDEAKILFESDSRRKGPDFQKKFGAESHGGAS